MTTTNMFLNFGGKWDSPLLLARTRVSVNEISLPELVQVN